MATDKEKAEYRTAMDKIKELQEALDKANTPSKERSLEDRIGRQLDRLEAVRDTVEKKKVEEEEEEDEDGDQCPECGGLLQEVEEGIYTCTKCRESFYEEEDA